MRPAFLELPTYLASRDQKRCGASTMSQFGRLPSKLPLQLALRCGTRNHMRLTVNSRKTRKNIILSAEAKSKMINRQVAYRWSMTPTCKGKCRFARNRQRKHESKLWNRETSSSTGRRTNPERMAKCTVCTKRQERNVGFTSFDKCVTVCTKPSRYLRVCRGERERDCVHRTELHTALSTLSCTPCTAFCIAHCFCAFVMHLLFRLRVFITAGPSTKLFATGQYHRTKL